MQRGKKSTAEKIIYSALDQVSSKSKRDPLEVFEEALDQVGPQVKLNLEGLVVLPIRFL